MHRECLRFNTANKGSISTADGSALVRLGETTIVCGVKAEIAEPELDRPEEGFLGALTVIVYRRLLVILEG